MRSPAADRLRPTPWDALVVVCILLAAAALVFALRPRAGDRLIAEVSLDGTVIARYDLDSLSGSEILEVEAPYPLTVEVEPGRIRVAESTCPGGDCLHSGWADQAGDRIICLPNRLIITLSGEDAPEFDAITS